MNRRASSISQLHDPMGTAVALTAAALMLGGVPAVSAQEAKNPQAPAESGQGMEPMEPMPSADLDTEMPDIGLDWPDLGADDPAIAVLPEETTGVASASGGTGLPAMLPDLDAETRKAEEQAERLARIDPAAALRYDVRLQGVDAIADPLFHTRFDALSELRKEADKEANIAQITRRAKADDDLLDKLMRTRGYYDARVFYQIEAEAAARQRVSVTLNVDPRELYHLSVVTLSGLSESDPREAAFRKLFTVKQGDPADTDKILASTEALRTGMVEGGYPFAKVEEPVLRVDHDEHDADLAVAVASGGFRRFGSIVVTGDPPFDAEHVQEIARFQTGDAYKQSEVVDLERALIQTGIVGSAEVSAKTDSAEGTVDLIVDMTRGPVRTIAGELGYGTGEGARAELSWQHRNLFPPEGSMTFRGVLGQQEQSASATFRRNNYGHRDRVLNGQLIFSNLNRPAYQATSLGVSASLERQTNIIFQKAWVWSLGTELIVSDERDLYGASLTPRRRTYFIAAAPLSLQYDGSDDLLDPKRGFRLGGRLSPELSLQSVTFGYVRAQIDGSAYFPASERLTLAGRVRLGTIVGSSSDRIAPTRRFYAGGGGSVRGYSYQAIGPRDLNNDPIGGRSLGEVSIEARFRFGSQNQFGIVPFIDAGTISSDPWPSIREMRVGAGLGVRYYSNFGPIRIDVGTPINPQPGDPRIGVYVSLGQAF